MTTAELARVTLDAQRHLRFALYLYSAGKLNDFGRRDWAGDRVSDPDIRCRAPHGAAERGPVPAHRWRW